jgi:hypothetical protein
MAEKGSGRSGISGATPRSELSEAETFALKTYLCGGPDGKRLFCAEQGLSAVRTVGVPGQKCA